MRLKTRFFWISCVNASIVGVVLCMIALFPYREIISAFLWQKTHSEYVFYIDPWDSAFTFRLGHHFFGTGTYDIQRAKYYFERTLKLNPQFTLAHYELARVFFLEGNFQTGLDHITRAIEINPEFHQAYYMRGLILGYQGDLSEAVAAFEEYIRRVPTTWAGYNDLAWLYFQLGDYEKTLSLSESGLKNSPENAWILNMHGLALHNLKRSEEARTYFERAKEKVDHMNPEDWGKAYPGNDPAIYSDGLARMREAITHNLILASPTDDSKQE